MLPVKELHGYHHGPVTLLDEPLEDCIPLKNIVVNGITYTPVEETNEEDTYSILEVQPSCMVREWRRTENA